MGDPEWRVEHTQRECGGIARPKESSGKEGGLTMVIATEATMSSGKEDLVSAVAATQTLSRPEILHRQLERARTEFDENKDSIEELRRVLQMRSFNDSDRVDTQAKELQLKRAELRRTQLKAVQEELVEEMEEERERMVAKRCVFSYTNVRDKMNAAIRAKVSGARLAEDVTVDMQAAVFVAATLHSLCWDLLSSAVQEALAAKQERISCRHLQVRPFLLFRARRFGCFDLR